MLKKLILFILNLKPSVTHSLFHLSYERAPNRGALKGKQDEHERQGIMTEVYSNFQITKTGCFSAGLSCLGAQTPSLPGSWATASRCVSVRCRWRGSPRLHTWERPPAEKSPLKHQSHQSFQTLTASLSLPSPFPCSCRFRNVTQGNSHLSKHTVGGHGHPFVFLGDRKLRIQSLS